MVFGTDAIRVLEDGDLETVGQEDYGGKLNNNFTAHPKIDPVTGLNNNN
jgi:carotenoid cleavage dioxygenase-like enzyme